MCVCLSVCLSLSLSLSLALALALALALSLSPPLRSLSPLSERRACTSHSSIESLGSGASTSPMRCASVSRTRRSSSASSSESAAPHGDRMAHKWNRQREGGGLAACGSGGSTDASDGTEWRRA
eukprot:4480569-Pleurochrysis_carterae.AAC.1